MRKSDKCALEHTDLLGRIDQVASNSVTPEEFKEFWGYTIDEHVENMMNYIHQLESPEMSAEEIHKTTKNERVLLADKPLTTEKVKNELFLEKRKKVLAEPLKEIADKRSSDLEAETLKRIADTLNSDLKAETLKRIADTLNLLIVRIKEQCKAERKRLVKDAQYRWELKLLAVPSKRGKIASAVTPIVMIGNLDGSVEKSRMVDRMYSPENRRWVLLPEFEFKDSSITQQDYTRDMKGLMVDIGNLKLDVKDIAPKSQKIILKK